MERRMSNVPTPKNFNSQTPAAPAGSLNIIFQADGNIPRNISAYLPAGAGQGGVNIQAGTSYTLQQSDQGAIVVLTNNAAVAVTAASTLPAKFSCTVLFVGTAGGTVTPSSGTIDNAAFLSFGQFAGALLVFDGTNWWAEGGTVSGGNPYIINCYLEGLPSTAEPVLAIKVALAVKFPANFSGSFGRLTANPTATAVYSITKNGSQIGTVSIATGGAFTFATSGGLAQSFAAGDEFGIVAPNPADATLSFVGLTFIGTR